MARPVVPGSLKYLMRRNAALSSASRGRCRATPRQWQLTGMDAFWPTACATGITVWDLPTGSPLALLPVSGEVKGVQFDPAGSILTSYPMTLRWPISSLPDGPVIGPPQLLQWYQTRDGFMNSRDGRVVAMANYDGGGLIFDADHPDRSRRILPHRDVRGIALSPDGRWLVTVRSETER